MGNGNSNWVGYDAQLMSDNELKSYCVPDSAEEGATPIYRHPDAKNGFAGYLSDEETKEELDTGWKLVSNACKNYPECPAYGWRPFMNENDTSQRGEYLFMNYKQVFEECSSMGNALRSFSLPDRANVGIYSSNRVEWILSHYANWSQSYRTVALYDTLGADAVAYIVGHAEMQLIFCEKNKLNNLWQAIESSSDCQLRFIVQFDYNDRYGNLHEKIDDSDREKAASYNIELIGLSELSERRVGANSDAPDADTETGDSDATAPDGDAAVPVPDGDGESAVDSATDNNEPQFDPPSPDDLAYIMYTSGTTGNPKGVMLSHSNFAAIVSSSNRGLEVNGMAINQNDTHVSFLPLAHIFETVILSSLFAVGASAAFFQGDIRKISEDWKSIRPSLMFGVPRIFNKTFDKVSLLTKSATGVKKLLINKAQKSSTKKIRDGRRSSFFDKSVWSKVSSQIGYDNIRFLLSGAAPLPPHVAEFLKIVCTRGVVVQGYGMTETTAAACVSLPNDLNLGHVGLPIDNCEVRLVNAPECEYFVTDEPCPRGEIQLRGPGIMQGYFKNEEATQKTLTDDKWLNTGDIGRINPNGTLSIIDRRKNMFKTSHGEYIAAEKIETVYSIASTIGQIWIYGNSYKPFVIAVIVPDAMVILKKWKSDGVWSDDYDNLKPGTIEFAEKFTEIASDQTQNDALKAHILDEINSLNVDLKKFEKIKDILIEHRIDSLLQGFTVERNTLTPSFKLRRPQLLNMYREQIKDLYAANGEPPIDGENW